MCRTCAVVPTLIGLVAGSSACNALWGIDELTYGPSTGSSGAGGAECCTPGETRSCYSGPDGTLDVGPCRAGSQTCSAGCAWGPCEGEVTPTVDSCSTDADEDCDAQPCHFVWTRTCGGPAGQFVQGIAVDSDDNTVITGFFRETLDCGGGPLVSAGDFDWFVAKFDPDGAHLFSRHYGDDQSQRGKAVAVDQAGNIVVAGYTEGSIDFGAGVLTTAGQSDVVLAKLDPDGNVIWSDIYGSFGAQDTEAVTINADGHIAVAGTYTNSFDLGGGNIGHASGSDVFVAVYDSSGAHIWSDGFGAANEQRVSHVALDPSGNLLLAGSFRGSFTFGGPLLTAAGNSDAYLAKLSPSGAHLWSDRYGDDVSQYAMSVTAAADDSLIAVGRFEGTMDLGGNPLVSAGAEDGFVGRFSAAGAHLQSLRFGNGPMERCDDVAIDSSNRALLVGAFDGALDIFEPPLLATGQDDVFIIQLDPSGIPRWAMALPVSDPVPPWASGDMRRRFVAPSKDDAFVVAGFYFGTLLIEGQTVPSEGGADTFIVKVP